MKTGFVDQNSIVRKIWGKADTVLFIFAGAAAEFALNKAVDWLYFTGRLPADPLGRLFSTVTYARKIIFLEADDALRAIDQISEIHHAVEKNRGAQIPAEAYLDVLFLLIDYSIRSFLRFVRNLIETEKAEVFGVFYRVGERMQLMDIPADYHSYYIKRQAGLKQNLVNSKFTADLYLQYKKHLGKIRYAVLKQVQLMLLPGEPRKMLFGDENEWIKPLLKGYKALRYLKGEGAVKSALLPARYKQQVRAIDGN
ncbi:MAG: oxygenase MpaB family protein [Mucilaginibacter sp.]